MSNVSVVLMQLAVQTPLLLAALVGMILALVFWRRGAAPAVCVLAASLLICFVMVGQTIIDQLLVQARIEHHWPVEQVSLYLSIVALVSSLLRGVAVTLFLIAAFIHRRGAGRADRFAPLPPLGGAFRT